jgi:hypothetical protein
VRYLIKRTLIGLLLTATIILSTTPLEAREMLWFGPVGKLPPRITSDLVIAPSETVINQPTQLSLIGGGFDYEMPIWMTETNDVSFLGGTHLTSLDTGAILPDSNVPLPHKFWDIRFGPAYRHKFNNKWVLGAMFEMGSASDEPFANYKNLTIMTNAFLRIPAKKHDSWIILLNYMNNREYLPHIPLPFGGYFMNRKKLRAFFGIPLALNIFPENKVSFELFYAPIAVVKAKVKTKVSKSVSFITGFNWNNYRYFRDGRTDKKDRLFYYEKRIYGGIEIAPDMRAKATLRVGYSFNRNLFESQSFWDRDYNRINVKAGPYARLELKLMLVSEKMLRRELEKYKRLMSDEDEQGESDADILSLHK